MINDIYNEAWENGYADGRRNAVLEVTEIIKHELHRRMIENDVIYIDDVVKLLDEVKANIFNEGKNI